MTLSGARGLVRVSINPQCDLQAAMAVERQGEPDFYRQVTGEEYPSDVEQAGSAQSCRTRQTPAPAGAPRGSSPATAAPPQCRASDTRSEPSLSRRTSGPSAFC